MTTVKPVLRRSHTKSKNGCQACKRGRKKCDEFRPACRQCIHGERTCIYVMQGMTKGGENVPLIWPDMTDESCKEWRLTGRPPFPIPNLPVTPSWHSMPLAELRFLHQMALVATILELSNTREMCLLWSIFPTFFQLAVNFDFVTYALTAKSAARLALVTKSSEAYQQAARYQNLALQGLNHAIANFSKDNADAILCASLGLQYQSNDWRSLMIIMEGTAQVTKLIRQMDKKSAFCVLLEQDLCQQSMMSTTPYLPRSNMVTVSGDSDRIVSILLLQGIDSLNGLASCLRDDLTLAAMVRQFRDALRLVQQREDLEWSIEDQFKLIHPFSAWITKYAISFIDISEKRSIILAVLAHMYAVVVVLSMALPAVDLPLFASIRIRGILEVDLILGQQPGFLCDTCSTFHVHSKVMDFPLNTVHSYQFFARDRLQFS